MGPYLSYQQVALLSRVNRWFYQLIYGDLSNQRTNRLWSALYCRYLSEAKRAGTDYREAFLELTRELDRGRSYARVVNRVHAAAKLGHEIVLKSDIHALPVASYDYLFDRAAQGGHRHILDVLINLGIVRKWSNHCIRGLAGHGYTDYIDRYLQGIDPDLVQEVIKSVLKGSGRKGNLEIYKKYYPMIQVTNFVCENAVCCNHVDIIRYVLSTGTLSSNEVRRLCFVAFDVIDLLLEEGAKL